MNSLFQKFCDFFPPKKMNTKIKKKLFYLIFSLFKFFLKGPFILNFEKIKLFAYPQKYDYTRSLLTKAQIPDPRERFIIKNNLIGSKNIFIDCGANFGCYSLDVWSSVHNCKIYAFEPSKKERFFLNENLKLNGASNINIIDLALGDRNGKVIFNDTRSIKEKNSGGGGFVTLNTAVSYEHYEVNITTLDKYFYNKIEEFKNSKIFIKIDLEGYDLKAIKGGKNLILNNNCSVVFEFSKMILKQEDYTSNYLIEFLNNGYKIYDIFGKACEIHELENRLAELDISHETCGNFFLTKEKLNFNYK